MTKEISDACDLYGHGGNIYRLAGELRMQERQIIDFSASVNPLGVSKKVKAEMRKHLKYLHNYPDPEAGRLRKRLAQYHGIDTETILCGNGSTGLIYLITKGLKPQRVLIPSPTFSEYEKACKSRSETRVMRYMLKEENNFYIDPDEYIKAMEGKSSVAEIQDSDSSPVTRHSSPSSDMAFLCNPNNPTGRLLRREDIIRIANAAKELKCYLIVDEAFMDFCADESAIKDVEANRYLIVLRSLTNFYALSGLRIGYGVFPRHLIGGLKECGEPWTVNSLAQRAAVVAIKDKVFRGETLKLIKGEKRFLEKSFRKLGIKFFSSDTNFYLLKVGGANEICRQLERRGILVRDCANFRGLDDTYLRVAVKSHRENTILIRELTTILQNLS